MSESAHEVQLIACLRSGVLKRSGDRMAGRSNEDVETHWTNIRKHLGIYVEVVGCGDTLPCQHKRDRRRVAYVSPQGRDLCPNQPQRRPDQSKQGGRRPVLLPFQHVLNLLMDPEDERDAECNT